MSVKNAFHDEKIEFISMDIPSGVNAQPFSDEETITGALNRAMNALKKGRGDIGIGLEGGVHESSRGLLLCNWGALASKDFEPIIAGGARFLLPEEIAIKLRAGKELGPVMDEYVNRQNVRKIEGAIGIFTNGHIDRSEMFTHITKMLFGQFQYKLNNKG